jgi:uncharacterized protein (DUF2237 family)
VYFVSYADRIAVGLTVDVEQNGGLSVCCDQRINGFYRFFYCSDITDPYGNARRCGLDHYLAQRVRGPDLSVDERQIKLMTLRKQPGGIHQVGAANRIQNVGNRNASGEQSRGIWHHLKLGDAAALNDDRRNAIQAVDAGFHVVGGDLP